MGRNYYKQDVALREACKEEVYKYQKCEGLDVAKMASHAIFQYNVLVIDIDNTNTWTNMIVKKTILRLLGSSNDKEKIGVVRPEGPPLRICHPTAHRSKRQELRHFAIIG